MTAESGRERALQAENDLLRNRLGLFDSGPTVAFSWRMFPSGPVVDYVSPNVGRLLGYSAEDFTSGRVVYPEIVHPDDVAAVGAALLAFLESDDEAFATEHRLRSAAGKVHWVHYHGTTTGHAPRWGATIHGFVLDVTDRKEGELRLARIHEDLVAAYDATLAGWVRALELRERATARHSRVVTGLTVRLARAMGVPEGELRDVARGALLHDIGKLAIPDAILLKEGPLTEAEWLVMRRHPEFARELLGPISFLRAATEIPTCHHERWDGTGYPRGLSGSETPLAARIFAVVDAWDALTSDRPYRPAQAAAATLAHLVSRAGSDFDPAVVEAFVRLDPERIAAEEAARGLGSDDGFQRLVEDSVALTRWGRPDRPAH